MEHFFFHSWFRHVHLTLMTLFLLSPMLLIGQVLWGPPVRWPQLGALSLTLGGGVIMWKGRRQYWRRQGAQ